MQLGWLWGVHSKAAKVLKDENCKELPLVTSKQHSFLYEGTDKIKSVPWYHREAGIRFASSVN